MTHPGTDALHVYEGICTCPEVPSKGAWHRRPSVDCGLSAHRVEARQQARLLGRRPR